ncbi:MAG TPA: zinc-binding dehydrogenase [Acidimicrobiia bacterium]|nr:zinc-binding dehydrogenase [Acidimicrobiia bacterium]
MRAAVARRGVLVVDDVADPVPGAGEALIAVKACGICGSDLHALRYGDELVATMAESGAPATFDPNRDFVMGHEFSGEVLELGPGTQGAGVAVGDLVTSLPVILEPTGEIEQVAYSNTYNGAYAERMRLTAGLCMKVPNGLDHRRAALTEPMSVGRHAVARAAMTKSESAIVLGAGPVGLAVVAELRRSGVETIIASDYSPRRRAVALAMGATATLDPAVEDPLDVWTREDGRRPPVVFDAIGVPGTLALACRLAPMFSRVCIVGSCMEADTLRPLIPQTKQLSIVFSFAYDPFEFGDTLRAIAEGEIDVAPMITGVCGIEGVPAAFDTLGRPEEHVKVLVEPGGPAVPAAL